MELPTHWPLSVVLGFPLWWALGLRTILPMALTLVMADQLLRRRTIALPGGFAFWALFLVWIARGLRALRRRPGRRTGRRPSRILVFAIGLPGTSPRPSLLWVANLRESELPTRWVYQLLGFMFVVTAVGGLVGVLAPTIEFTSPVEMLLPRGLRGNGLVQAIVHPAVADIQNVLGRPEARPKAPFPYANSWGATCSLFLPFFLVAWFRQGPRWQRFVGPVVLAMAAIPVVYSLNRGLWVAWRSAPSGSSGCRWARGDAGACSPPGCWPIAVIFLLSPLGTIFQERLDHQHSNDRRGQLLAQTVTSTLEGSPVVGFGSTRDVQGSFASIAGASTPDCKAAASRRSAPRATSGSSSSPRGSSGLLLFLSFFVMALARCWRCRTPTETLCTFTLAFFLCCSRSTTPWECPRDRDDGGRSGRA